jgi:thymidylate synthase (FAD)
MRRMARITVPAAEALLDPRLDVLDHGFVRLVDYLGGDARIVQAARVSYGEGTKTAREDRALIDYLLRNRHTSPFEQVILTFHVKMPIFVARQWIRHRTARVNEISGRYSVMADDFYLPRPFEVRFQSAHDKQGSAADEVPEALRERVIAILREGQRRTYGEYEQLLEDGIARELARVNLPLSLYTELYWQIDLNNLFHFLRLRLDWHAQYEIRAYGDAIGRCVRAVAPLAFEAFEDHVLNARTLSGSELRAVVAALDPARLEAASSQAGLGRSRRNELWRKLGLPEVGGGRAAAAGSDATASADAPEAGDRSAGESD